MSWMEATEPRAGQTACDALELVVVPKPRDIGGFKVSRVLPSARRRAVGPFVFFDQMGPARLPAGEGLDVRPHPHIGLSTITYLFEGEMLHRDSLGTVQPIRPGEVNWMTAGRGVVHSERSPEPARAREQSLAGIQAWVALPLREEECGPAFRHLGVEALPEIDGEGNRLRLVAGGAFGARSPLDTGQDLLYADCRMKAGASLQIEPDYPERGAYLVAGTVEIAGERFDAGQLLVFREGVSVRLDALAETRFMLLGGEPLDAPRFIWWNFVSSSRERIEQAKADWREGRFAAVPGDDEWIPLPD
ncbi:pirin family protein [Ectothiorhodospiraceae bacterium WFHF3C12]|nr:pirin family protein [Ectothiorhodospiraceae bacterium WFHF3C12]